MGWERENRAPRGCEADRFGNCKRRVWLFLLPSDGRGSGVRGNWFNYASGSVLSFAQTLSAGGTSLQLPSVISRANCVTLALPAPSDTACELPMLMNDYLCNNRMRDR